jgi:hypothetical protein
LTASRSLRTSKNDLSIVYASETLASWCEKKSWRVKRRYWCHQVGLRYALQIDDPNLVTKYETRWTRKFFWKGWAFQTGFYLELSHAQSSM